MKGILFNGLDKKQYYYSPKTGKIVSTQGKLVEDDLREEDFTFNFGSDRRMEEKYLDSQLDTLILEGTQDCNMRCSYCIYGGGYLGERNHNGWDMSPEIAFNSVEYFLAHSEEKKPFRFISFYGGEPLVNFNLLERVVSSFQGAPRLRFGISTNGLLLERYADFLKENNVSVVVSLDGPKEVHDKNRLTLGGKPTFEQVIRGVSAMGPDSISKGSMAFSSTITHKDDFKKSYEFFRDNFRGCVARMEFVKGYDRIGNPGERLYLEEENIGKMFQDYKEGIITGDSVNTLRFLFDDMFKRILVRPRDYSGGEINPGRTCLPGARKLFCKPDGKFYICEKLGYDSFEIGSTEKGIDKDKVFKLMEFFMHVSQEECSNCPLTQLCNVCIPVSGLSQGEFSSERYKKSCATKEKNIKMFLGMYVDLINDVGEERLLSYLGH